MAACLKRGLIGVNFRIQAFRIRNGFCIQFSQIKPGTFGSLGEMLAFVPVFRTTPI